MGPMVQTRTPFVALLEAPWVEGFVPEGCLLPATSALPFLDALASRIPIRYVRREFRSVADLRCWCSALGGPHLGPKVVWLAGHGVWAVGAQNEAVDLRAPNSSTLTGNRIAAADVRRQLARCGSTGVIVLGCGFGRNKPESWLPKNVNWALAFARAIDLFEGAIYCMRALLWLFSVEAPRSGSDAHRSYRLGVLTGRNGYGEYRYDHRAIATVLGARFFWREGGKWQICAAPDFE